jgi:hypothetical protein
MGKGFVMQQIATQPFSVDQELLSWQEQMADETLAPAGNANLPTILLATALLMVATGSTFFITYFVLTGSMVACVIMTALIGLFAVGPLNIVSAWLTATPVGLSNLLWSIGLLVVVLFLFGLCSIFGAVAALVVQAVGLG